jgi:hypothetical protein
MGALLIFIELPPPRTILLDPEPFVGGSDEVGALSLTIARGFAMLFDGVEIQAKADHPCITFSTE